MQGQYLGLLELIALSAIICAVMVIGSWLLGPKKSTPYKMSPYECGVAPEGSARERFPIQFYLVAIMFILFDIEVVFLWSWMTVYGTASTAFKVFTFVEFILYMVTWIVGYLYMLRVNAIQWDETMSLHPEKLGLQEELSGQESRELVAPSLKVGRL